MRMIDADAFKDYLRGALYDVKHLYKDLYKDNGAWAEEITESFCKDIDEQPTIEPPTGKWEDKSVLEDSKAIDAWQSARCSNCGKYHTTPYMYYFDVYEFCPHCGARMEVEGWARD